MGCKLSLRQTVQDLSGLPEKMLQAALEALLEQARLARDLAKVYVRRDTGACGDSIRVERGGVDANRVVVFVRAGGYVVNPKTGRLVDYAAALEAKYPYLRPAMEEVKPQIADAYNRFFIQHVEEVEKHGVLRFR